MVGSDASEKGFRSAANEYGILHLGTHAEMNASSPMYSRLVLSKDGSGVDADADGYLHAYEIYELDLRAQLAVLTACETGIGKDDEGEGLGEVTSGTFSPTLRQGIGLALLERSVEDGETVEIDVRGRSELFTVTKPPFVEPSTKEN